MAYSTRTTRLEHGYGCRVYRDGVLIVEGRCKSRQQIGATFRDLLRTLDTLGGDAYTAAARKRKYKAGNMQMNVRHIWGNRQK